MDRDKKFMKTDESGGAPSLKELLVMNQATPKSKSVLSYSETVKVVGIRSMCFPSSF